MTNMFPKCLGLQTIQTRVLLQFIKASLWDSQFGMELTGCHGKHQGRNVDGNEVGEVRAKSGIEQIIVCRILKSNFRVEGPENEFMSQYL